VGAEEIRVLIVDDGEPMRRALRLRLEGQSDIRVVGEARAASEAVRQLRESCSDIDIAIVSFTAPSMDYAEAVATIKNYCDGLGILVLTPYEDGAERALAAGASAHLLKETDTAVLVAAIKRIVEWRQSSSD
jgi:DNA-binding NarL/FixJ family response regulator